MLELLAKLECFNYYHELDLINLLLYIIYCNTFIGE